MALLDFYKILESSPEATSEELKKAYRRLSKEYHPDVNGDLSEEERGRRSEHFKELSVAYSVVSNPESRKKYDRAYRKYQEAQQRKETHQREEAERRETEKKQQEKPGQEKKANQKNTFYKRHQQKSRYIYKHYKEEYEQHPIIFRFQMGLIHVGAELFYQCSRLKPKKEESLKQYMNRNKVRVPAAAMAAFILANTISAGHTTINQEGSNENVLKSQISFSSDPTTELYQSTQLTLMRIHKVKAGDTLSEFSAESNTKENYIKQINGLENSNILVGTTLKVPYIMTSEDLEFCTESRAFEQNESLEEYASRSETNIQTLLLLNRESIIEQNNNYAVLSDTLTVPNFISHQELKEQKQTTKVKSKN